MEKETAIQITALLSDAQEYIERGNKEEARELINEAKITLFTAVQEDAGALARSLTELTPFYLFQVYLTAKTGDADAIKKIPPALLEDCLTSWEKAINHINDQKN